MLEVEGAREEPSREAQAALEKRNELQRSGLQVTWPKAACMPSAQSLSLVFAATPFLPATDGSQRAVPVCEVEAAMEELSELERMACKSVGHGGPEARYRKKMDQV